MDGPTLVNAPTTQIQIAFDRLLLSTSAIRQSLVLEDGSGNPLNPQIAYDPYTRVVTITPPGPVLPAGQNYRIYITQPTGPKDPNGLRAIDGAPIDPAIRQPLIVPVPASIPTAPTLPAIDFCSIILPHVFQHCGGGDCHTQSPPAAGLLLDNPQDSQATAMNRIAQGSNTGPSLGPNNAPVVTAFGIDMPIIDQNGADPANSWLLYKILMAKPDTSNDPDGGVPNNYAVAWQPLTPDERARLASLIPGREMPYPSLKETAETNSIALADGYYEDLSLWIAQGAHVTQCP